MRTPLILVATLAVAGAIPARAATIIETGSYSPGQNVANSGNVALGTGRYRFTLRFTGQVQNVDAAVIKTINTDFYCTDPAAPGAGEFYCGGDDVPDERPLLPVTANTFQTVVTALPPRTYLSPGDFITRTVDSDACCGYRYQFDAIGAGSYVLSLGTVPEPATWAMLIAGFGMIGARLRRRRAVRDPALARA